MYSIIKKKKNTWHITTVSTVITWPLIEATRIFPLFKVYQVGFWYHGTGTSDIQYNSEYPLVVLEILEIWVLKSMALSCCGFYSVVKKKTK